MTSPIAMASNRPHPTTHRRQPARRANRGVSGLSSGNGSPQESTDVE
jgi:hypothetical protein